MTISFALWEIFIFAFTCTSIGAFMGVVAMALCVVSGRGDR